MWAVILVGVLLLGAFGAAAGKKPAATPATDTKGAATTTASPPNSEAAAPPDTERSTTTVKATTTTIKTTTTTAKATTTTERVTTTTAPAFGTRENPIPLGLEVPGGDWNYTVIAYEPGNIDQLLHQFNQFNDPPPAGKMTVRVRYRLKYTGSGSGSAMFTDLNLVGASGTTYGPNDYACCAPETDALRDQPETFNGGTIEGYVYYQITPEDAMGKLLAFDPNVNYTDVPGGVGFFAVN